MSYSVISYKGAELPKAYHNMVYSKWLRSLRYGNDDFKLIDQNSYFRAYPPFLRARIADPRTLVRLAVLADDYDVVLGFAVMRNDVLDYVHVHKDYRRTGVGTALVPGGIEVITHITRQGMSFWNNRLSKAIFNPFI